MAANTTQATAASLGGLEAVIEKMYNEEKRQMCIAELKELVSLIGAPGASAKAADEALSMIYK